MDDELQEKHHTQGVKKKEKKEKKGDLTLGGISQIVKGPVRTEVVHA